MKRAAIPLLLALLLPACAGEQTRPPKDPVAQLAAARSQFAEEEYDQAAETLRDLLASRPPADLRVEAAFLAGETALAKEEYVEARTYFTEFRDLYPGNPRVPEAVYWIAESWYRERNPRDRDVSPLREARAAFMAFLAAYPSHPLAASASGRAAECTEALVSYELGVADLYLGRGATAGAVVRLEGILREYPGAPQEDRVLHDLAVALDRAGETGRAAAARERLLREHPDSPWTQKAVPAAQGGGQR